MKKMMIAAVLLSQIVHAEAPGRGASALQTLVPADLTVRLSAGKDLKEECSRIERTVGIFSRPGNDRRVREYLQTARAIQWVEGVDLRDNVKFRADLEPLNDLASAEQKKAAAAQLEARRSEARNPEFLLAAEQVQLWPAGFAVSAKNVRVLKPGALVETAQRVGLEASPVDADLTAEGLEFSVYGLDLACDLVAGRVELVATPTLRVYPAEREIKNLQRVFGDVSDLAEKAFAKDGSVNAKVARFSYRLAKEWETLSRDLPKAKNEDEQALGFAGMIVDYEAATVLGRSLIEEKTPDFIEVKNAPVRFEVVR